MQSESFLPLKSPKRFFSFSGPHSIASLASSPSSPHPNSWSTSAFPASYPIPSEHINARPRAGASPLTLGSGATVVRTPAEALQGSMLRPCDRLDTLESSPAETTVKQPTTAGKETWTVSSSGVSSAGSYEVSSQDPLSIPDFPKRPARPTEAPDAFGAFFLGKVVRPLPPQPLAVEDVVIVTLELAYTSSASIHDGEPARVIVPLDILRDKAEGSRLVDFIEKCLGMEHQGSEGSDPGPEFTDGESAYSEESLKEARLSADIDSLVDPYADLDALLSDETTFELSLESSLPARHKLLPDLPSDPRRSTKKRALLRNQQNLFPSPSSALCTKSPKTDSTAPLVLRPSQPGLRLRLSSAPRRTPLRSVTSGQTLNAHKSLTELRVLLLRPAEPYHAIIAYLLRGSFPAAMQMASSSGGTTTQEALCAIIAEAQWLGMTRVCQAARALLQPRPSEADHHLISKKVRCERGRTAGWI